jgi:TIR domain
MATKVFISWSGELSRKLAEAIRQWLPATLQFVRPYFTPSDIEKGTKWMPDISGELEDSNIGIICLTRENLNSPWILFESGALSKNLEQSRVCTLLFDLEPTDVAGPLALLQHTRFKQEDFRKLVETINNAETDSKLGGGTLDTVFAMWWPKLEEQVTKILSEHQPADPGARRPVEEMVEEILELTRLHMRRHPSPRVPETLKEHMQTLARRGGNLSPGDLRLLRARFRKAGLTKPEIDSVLQKDLDEMSSLLNWAISSPDQPDESEQDAKEEQD